MERGGGAHALAEGLMVACEPTPPPVRRGLFEVVRETIRARHYSRRIEKA